MSRILLLIVVALITITGYKNIAGVEWRSLVALLKVTNSARLVINLFAMKVFLIALLLSVANGQSNRTVDLASSPGEACFRPCSRNAAPRVCYFKWHLEHYQVLGP
jgi:hypothetical protein